MRGRQRIVAAGCDSRAIPPSGRPVGWLEGGPGLNPLPENRVNPRAPAGL